MTTVRGAIARRKPARDRAADEDAAVGDRQ